MMWAARLSGAFSALLLVLVLSPSFQSFPPAEAIRSSHFTSHLRQRLPSPSLLRKESFHDDPPLSAASSSLLRLSFHQAPSFRNAADGQCPTTASSPSPSICDPSLIHIALTLDDDYLRGSIAAVHSILHHARCPTSLFFHFLSLDPSLASVVRSAFPDLHFKVYPFDPTHIRRLISTSVRHALEQPLNYARNYLPSILPRCVHRVIYLDSDLVVVDDVANLWRTDLQGKPLGAPEYCHANFTSYFTARFWADPDLAATFSRRRTKPCYFNTGVMVIDLDRWRGEGYARRLERWMEVQKEGEGGGEGRIYELGSLPPFLLVFAGDIKPIEHRWNQHGLGGDNVKGSCRDLHPGPVSLLHWSGSGKPWVRLDSRRPCPLDALWAPFDLYGPAP